MPEGKTRARVDEAAAPVVTIVFTDIVASTTLLQRLGDERAHAVFRDHHALLRQVIDRMGGQELRWLGDGAMAVFPEAAAALRGAIAIQQAVRHGTPHLRLRIGVHLGEVVHDATSEAAEYVGAAVVTARRLCDRAAAGTILCGQAVADAVGPSSELRFQPLGQVTLKGIDEPVSVCELLFPSEPAIGRGLLDEDQLPLPAACARLGDLPFTGRERELGLLRRAWQEVMREGGRLAVVHGEPGVGKTRLVSEIGRQVHAEGAFVLLGRCDEGIAVPYQPFVEALRHVIERAPPQALRGHLGRQAGELVRLEPRLASRLPDLPPPLVSDPASERYRLFEAVAGWLVATAAFRPLLLVIDDLQWAAPATLLLLRYVARATREAPVLLLASYRSTESEAEGVVEAVLAEMAPVLRTTTLTLAGLDETAVGQLVAARAEGTLSQRARQRLAAAVHAATGGNPFFLGEVLRHLAETKGFARAAEVAAEDDQADAARNLPANVRTVVARRVRRLSPEAVHVLRLAALVGSDFDAPLLLDVCGMAESTLLSALEESCRAGLVIEAGVERYRFAHALVQQTLETQLSVTRRARLHRQIGEAIEARRPDDAPALAQQFLRAGPEQIPKAVRYCARAGELAMQRLAHAEAVRHFRAALDLADRLPTQEATDRIERLCRLGEAQKGAGDPGHRGTLLQAAHLALRHEDRQRLVRAALANHRGWGSQLGAVDTERVAVLEAALERVSTAEPAIRARVLATLAAELQYAGDPDRRRQLSDEALQFARRANDPETMAHVLAVRGHTIWGPSSLGERLANAAEHAAVVAGLGDPLARWYAAATRLQVNMEAGDLAEVDRCLALLAVLTQELGSQAHLVYAQTIDRAWRALLAGRLAEADQIAAEACEVGRESGQPDALTYYVGQLVGIRYEQGRLGELAPVLAQAVAENPAVPAFRAACALASIEGGQLAEARRQLEGCDPEAIPVDLAWSTAMVHWVAVAAALGARQVAAELQARLAPFADHVAFNGLFVADTFAHALGLAAAVQDRLAEAAQWLGHAAVMAERLGAPALLARSRVAHAAVLVRRAAPGDRERAGYLRDAALEAAQACGLGLVERLAAGVRVG